MTESTPPPIHYTVRFPAELPHYVDIEARIPVDGELQVELFLPVWTPGSYLVREYARHVESLTAADPENNLLPVIKTRKNRWLIECNNPLHSIIVRYLIYCNELTVPTNYRDESLAVLNGAATFLTILDRSVRPHEVRVELPLQW